MTATPVRHLAGRSTHWLGGVVASGLVLLAVIGVALGAHSPLLLRPIVAVPITALLLTVALLSPRRAVLTLLVWLAIFGSLRRLLLLAEAPAASDPLLLVAPAVLVMLVAIAGRRGAFRDRTPLSNAVLVLGGLAVMGAVNPLQGGLSVGLAGLLFVLVPMLWFWVGRVLVDDELLDLVLLTVSVVAIGAAVYGLFQVYSGLPSWDRNWVEVRGYSALRIAGSLRPFASLASAGEYVGLLTVGFVIWTLRLRSGHLHVVAVGAVILLGWALTLASVRGALVVVPVALGMTVAAANGYGPLRTLAAGVAALFLLGLLVSSVNPKQVGGARTSALLARQVTGLSDPFDPNSSTLPAHLDLLVGGLQQSVRHPLGLGLGSVTIAADRFGSTARTTETDPSNVAVALGAPGLVAYATVVGLGLAAAFRRARMSKSLGDHRGPLVLAVALVMLFQWLNGGNYAVAPLPWLMLGWLDRPRKRAAVAEMQGLVEEEGVVL